jgi:hypothetical protein
MLTPPRKLDSLLRRLGGAVGATEAVAFAAHPDQFGEDLTTLVHVRPDNAPDEVCERAIRAFREIVRPLIQEARDAAVEVARSQNERGTQFCLVAMIRREDTVIGASAFIIRRHNRDQAEAMLKRAQRAWSGS